jgi:DNA (cytosine-5)-methyltransferase 1
LFSGIGGLDLGFEKEGFDIRGQVEIDPLLSAVLARHWPDIPRHNDVRTFDLWHDSLGNPPYDVIIGGFPCQPFSHAGARRGTDDDRWLWPSFYDIIRLVEPRYVVIENVPGLRTINDGAVFRGILGDLAASGYNAEWSCVSATSLGYPHRRMRLFIVAHTDRIMGQSWDLQQAIKWDELCTIQDVEALATQALASFNFDGREADGSSGGMAVANGLTARMVGAGGNAVIPGMARIPAQVVKHINAGGK